MRKSLLMSITTVIAAMPLAPALAATATGNLNVQIIIEASCTVATPASLNFGTHGVLGSNVDVATPINVTCTNLLPYTVSLGAGTGSGATVSDRNMTGTLAETVDYQLFRDPTRTQNWGETIGTDTVAGTGTGAVVGHQVYGRVPTQTTPRADTYTDQVLVTVTY